MIGRTRPCHRTIYEMSPNTPLHCTVTNKGPCHIDVACTLGDDGSVPPRVAAEFDEREPALSPDGQELFFSLPGTAFMMSQVETEPTFAAGTPERVFDTTGYRLGTSGTSGRRYNISSDGERFVMVRFDQPQLTRRDGFNGVILVENWFQELTERVPTGR